MHIHPTPGIDRKERYVALTTYRDSGAAVTTPVWFVGGPHDLQVTTGATAGKVRRIRAHPGVLVAPCDVRGRVTGPAVTGMATVSRDPADLDLLVRAIAEKYGWQARVASRLEGLRRQMDSRVMLTITLDAND